MGIFSVRIAVGDPQGTHFEEFDAMLDTGSTDTSLPASVLHRLGVVPHHKEEFEFADGRIAESDVGFTWLRVDGRETVTEVVFAEEGTEPLLGMMALEAMTLGIDPIRQVLVPVRKKRKTRAGWLLNSPDSSLLTPTAPPCTLLSPRCAPSAPRSQAPFSCSF